MENDVAVRNQKVFVRLGDVITLMEEYKRLKQDATTGNFASIHFRNGLRKAIDILQLPIGA